jgi:four helix bundle protein
MMMRPSSPKDLAVWQKSIALASKVFVATAQPPQDGHRDLWDHMRRSAVAVASNVGEGAARNNRNDYLRFLNFARSSLAELETQIYIAAELDILRQDLQLKEASAEVGRLLTTLVQRLREQRNVGSPSAYGYGSAPPLS